MPQFETCGQKVLPQRGKFRISPRCLRIIVPSARFTISVAFYNSLPGLFTVPLTRMTDLLSRLNIFLAIILCGI